MSLSVPRISRLFHVERTLIGPDGKCRSVQVNLKECPLSWLRARDHITDRQFHAGGLLQNDWEAAGLGARVTMSWNPVPPDRNVQRARASDPTQRHSAGRARFDGAMAAAGPDLQDVLWRVVCAGEGLSTAERALGWPARAGKLVLGFALDRIADYYRVP